MTDADRVAKRIIAELLPQSIVATSPSPDAKLFGAPLMALIEEALRLGCSPDKIDLRKLNKVANWMKYGRPYGDDAADWLLL